MAYHLYSREDIDNHKVTPQPGDFIVTHGKSFFSWLIRFATFSRWNHAALVVTTDGTIIEALGNGLRQNAITKYPADQFHLMRVELSDSDREQVVAYAEAMLKRHPKYGFLDIATIALKILTHARFVIKLDGTFICSEFVAKSLAQGGVIWYKDTSLITPADLYRRFVEQKVGAED